LSKHESFSIDLRDELLALKAHATMNAANIIRGTKYNPGVCEKLNLSKISMPLTKVDDKSAFNNLASDKWV
jgi:hypothetical protein